GGGRGAEEEDVPAPGIHLDRGGDAVPEVPCLHQLANVRIRRGGGRRGEEHEEQGGGHDRVRSLSEPERRGGGFDRVPALGCADCQWWRSSSASSWAWWSGHGSSFRRSSAPGRSSSGSGCGHWERASSSSTGR